MRLEISRQILENFVKIDLVGAELFHVDRSRGGQTDVTKPITCLSQFCELA